MAKKESENRKKRPGYEGSWLEWSWKDERTFINQLGRRLKSVDDYFQGTRFHSDYSRLELLNRYLYVCQNLRVRWCKRVLKSQVIPYIELAIEKEQQKEMEEEYYGAR